MSRCRALRVGQERRSAAASPSTPGTSTSTASTGSRRRSAVVEGQAPTAARTAVRTVVGDVAQLPPRDAVDVERRASAGAWRTRGSARRTCRRGARERARDAAAAPDDPLTSRRKPDQPVGQARVGRVGDERRGARSRRARRPAPGRATGDRGARRAEALSGAPPRGWRSSARRLHGREPLGDQLRPDPGHQRDERDHREQAGEQPPRALAAARGSRSSSRSRLRAAPRARRSAPEAGTSTSRGPAASMSGTSKPRVRRSMLGTPSSSSSPWISSASAWLRAPATRTSSPSVYCGLTLRARSRGARRAAASIAARLGVHERHPAGRAEALVAPRWAAPQDGQTSGRQPSTTSTADLGDAAVLDAEASAPRARRRPGRR